MGSGGIAPYIFNLGMLVKCKKVYLPLCLSMSSRPTEDMEVNSRHSAFLHSIFVADFRPVERESVPILEKVGWV